MFHSLIIRGIPKIPDEQNQNIVLNKQVIIEFHGSNLNGVSLFIYNLPNKFYSTIQ